MGDRKHMSVKEFREKGYLQEINRCFLHQLGLALEVIRDEETGDERLGGIWDCRDDKEGIFFDYAQSDQDRVDAAQKKRDYVWGELERRRKDREEALGFLEEPIERMEVGIPLEFIRPFFSKKGMSGSTAFAIFGESCSCKDGDCACKTGDCSCKKDDK